MNYVIWAEAYLQAASTTEAAGPSRRMGTKHYGSGEAAAPESLVESQGRFVLDRLRDDLPHEIDMLSGRLIAEFTVTLHFEQIGQKRKSPTRVFVGIGESAWSDPWTKDQVITYVEEYSDSLAAEFGRALVTQERTRRQRQH